MLPRAHNVHFNCYPRLRTQCKCWCIHSLRCNSATSRTLQTLRLRRFGCGKCRHCGCDGGGALCSPRPHECLQLVCTRNVLRVRAVEGAAVAKHEGDVREEVVHGVIPPLRDAPLNEGQVCMGWAHACMGSMAANRHTPQYAQTLQPCAVRSCCRRMDCRSSL